MAGYLDNDTLAALVRAHRRNKRRPMSEDLGKALEAIAGGVWDRFRFTSDRGDFVQDVVLHLLGRPIAKANPVGNLFSYFTTCAVRHGNKLRQRELTERVKLAGYVKDCKLSGRHAEEGILRRRSEHRDALEQLVAAEDLAGDAQKAEEFFRWLEEFRDAVALQLAAARVTLPPRPRKPRRRRRASRRPGRGRAT